MVVQSVLSCLHAALVDMENRYRTDSSCADVTAIAQDLVSEALHRLDSAFLKPFVDALKKK